MGNMTEEAIVHPPRQDDDAHHPPLWRRPIVLAWTTAAVIGVFYLLREHLGHVLGAWPYLVLLLCPLMHLLHGHGGHQARHGQKNDGA